MRRLLTALYVSSLFVACGGESGHDGNEPGNHAGNASGGTSGTSGSAGHGTGGSGAAGHGNGGTFAFGGSGGDIAGSSGTSATGGRAEGGGSGGDIAGTGGSGDIDNLGGTGGAIAGRGGSAGAAGFGGRNCGPFSDCGGQDQGGTAGSAGRLGCGTGLECAGRGQGGTAGGGGVAGYFPGGYGGYSGQGQAGMPSAQVCGGLAGTPCPPGMYCQYDYANACTLPDSTGYCRATGTEQCANKPVCGCDGKTYQSACRARSAGVDTTDPSNCPTAGDAGDRCLVDDVCNGDLKCCASPLGVLTCMTPAGSMCPLLP